MKTLISAIALAAATSTAALASDFSEAFAANDTDTLEFILEDGRNVLNYKEYWASVDNGNRDALSWSTYQTYKGYFKSNFDVAPNDPIILDGQLGFDGRASVRQIVEALDAHLNSMGIDNRTGEGAFLDAAFAEAEVTVASVQAAIDGIGEDYTVTQADIDEFFTGTESVAEITQLILETNLG